MKKLRLPVTFLLILLSYNLQFAQSGRVLPTPTPTPEVSKTTETQRENPLCEVNNNEIELIGFSQRHEFIEELNNFGLCGYHLEKIVRFGFQGNETFDQMAFAGVVKKDEINKYGYSWFIAQRPGEAQTLANNLAEKGFYLKKAMSFTIGACSEQSENTKQQNKDSGGVLGTIQNLSLGNNGIFFLFERRIGNEKKNEYRVIDAFDSRTKDIRINENKMQELIANGFRPVDFWYLGFLNYNFLIMEKDNDIKPKGEYILIKNTYRKEKTLTKLAEDGYKLLIQGGDVAVLNRLISEPLNIQYESISSYKDLRKNLLKLEKNGGEFVETGIDFYQTPCDPSENVWYFTLPTQKTENNSKAKQISLLRLYDFEQDFIKANVKVPLKTNPLTKEQKIKMQNELNKLMNQMIKENYQIINFDYLNLSGFTIMFERPKQ